MSLKDKIYNKYYPLTVINRTIARRRNNNKDFSLLTPNCMGGYIYHQLGLSFMSPTVNTMIKQTDFYKFITDIDKYINADFAEAKVMGGVPQGKLEDIAIYFTHYKTFEQGRDSWNKRKARIHYDNLYIIIQERDGLTPEMIENLSKVKCKKLVCFTASKYPYPYCFQVKECQALGVVSNMLGKTLSGKWKFERFFDYVGWLNDSSVDAEDFRIGE